MVEIGDLGLVWSWQSFLFGGIFGFGFGYLILASISAQERWRTANSARAYAWLTGVLCAYFLVGLSFAFAFAALLEGDPAWPRLISRIGPDFAVSIGVGLGVWRGLVRATGLGGANIPARVGGWWYGAKRRVQIGDDDRQAKKDDASNGR